MVDIAPIFVNQNRYVERQQKSHALYGKEWGRVNSNVGQRTASYNEAGFLLKVVSNYFSSFVDAENNPMAKFLSSLFLAGSSGLHGKRDQEMYDEAYATGLDDLNSGEIKAEDFKHDDRRVLNKLGRLDDLSQNLQEEAMFGEKVVAQSGRLAAQTSRLKPLLYTATSFFGYNTRNLIWTVLDINARRYWRERFFGKSLHSNFVTSQWELLKSSFTGNYQAKAKELGQFADKYFQNKYKGKYKSGKVGLNLYWHMILDRMKEHWNAISNPEAALKEKCNKERGSLHEVSEEERKLDPMKSFHNGYVNPKSELDQNEQRRLALTDFTGPICGALGLIGTYVFDPLKIIFNFAGVEKGKHVIDALSASRKTFSLINYIPRFIWDEYNQGATYKELEPHMNKKNVSKALAELYYARKARYNNAVIGMAMAASTIVEPLIHLWKPKLGDSKLTNFLVTSLVDFNDSFFLRFFSMRRGVQGRLNHVNGIAREKLGLKHVGGEDYLKLDNKAYDASMKTAKGSKEGRHFVVPFLDTAASKLVDVKRMCSGESVYDSYNPTPNQAA